MCTDSQGGVVEWFQTPADLRFWLKSFWHCKKPANVQIKCNSSFLSSSSETLGEKKNWKFVLHLNLNTTSKILVYMVNLEGSSVCNDYLIRSGKYKWRLRRKRLCELCEDYIKNIYIKNSFVFPVMDVKNHDNVFS